MYDTGLISLLLAPNVHLSRTRHLVKVSAHKAKAPSLGKIQSTPSLADVEVGFVWLRR